MNATLKSSCRLLLGSAMVINVIVPLFWKTVMGFYNGDGRNAATVLLSLVEFVVVLDAALPLSFILQLSFGMVKNVILTLSMLSWKLVELCRYTSGCNATLGLLIVVRLCHVMCDMCPADCGVVLL